MTNNYNTDFSPYHLIYTHPSSFSLYLGDINAATNLNFIHSQRISTVITAALGMDQLDYSQIQIKHIIYPLLDGKREDVSQFFQQFYAIVEKQIKVGSVLVHCSSGLSRSPTLVIAYLMKKQFLTFKDAIQFVRNKGRKVVPNIGFQKQLKTYEVNLRNNIFAIQQRKHINTPIQSGKKKQNSHKSNRSELPHVNTQSKTFLLLDSLSLTTIFNTISSRNRSRTNHQFRKNKLNASQMRQQLNSSSLNRQNRNPSDTQHLINNFQVKKIQMNERSIRPKKIKSKIIVNCSI